MTVSDSPLVKNLYGAKLREVRSAICDALVEAYRNDEIAKQTTIDALECCRPGIGRVEDQARFGSWMSQVLAYERKAGRGHPKDPPTLIERVREIDMAVRWAHPEIARSRTKRAKILEEIFRKIGLTNTMALNKTTLRGWLNPKRKPRKRSAGKPKAKTRK